MKSIKDLTTDDYIAFKFEYGSFEKDDLIVDKITEIYEDRVLIHFLYGWKSESEWVKFDEILAIGNLESGKNRLSGWAGTYDILQPNHPLIIKNLK